TDPYGGFLNHTKKVSSHSRNYEGVSRYPYSNPPPNDPSNRKYPSQALSPPYTPHNTRNFPPKSVAGPSQNNDIPPYYTQSNAPQKSQAPRNFPSKVGPSQNNEVPYYPHLNSPQNSQTTRNFPPKVGPSQNNEASQHPHPNHSHQAQNTRNFSTKVDHSYNRNNSLYPTPNPMNNGTNGSNFSSRLHQIRDQETSSRNMPPKETLSSYEPIISESYYPSPAPTTTVPRPIPSSGSSPYLSTGMHLRKALAAVSPSSNSVSQEDEPPIRHRPPQGAATPTPPNLGPPSTAHPPSPMDESPHQFPSPPTTQPRSRSQPYLNTPPSSHFSSPNSYYSDSPPFSLSSDLNTKMDPILNRISDEMLYSELMDILEHPSLLFHLNDLLRFKKGVVNNPLSRELIYYLNLLDYRPWNERHFTISRQSKIFFFKQLCSKKYTLSPPSTPSSYSFFSHFIPFLYFLSHPSLHKVAPVSFSEIFYPSILVCSPDLLETFLTMTSQCLEAGELTSASSSPIFLFSFAQLFAPMLQLLEILTRMHSELVLNIITKEKLQQLSTLILTWEKLVHSGKLQTCETKNAVASIKVHFGVIQTILKF
ncbi:hypothetical protein HMI55_001224, partial [Coelomomyces lativittatus]